MLFALLWYKKRVDLLSRKPYLLEKAIFNLGLAMLFINNPFYSIWSTSLGTNLAYIFIYLSLISAVVYFIFLAYWIARVILTIKRRRPSLAAMKEGRRVKFEGIIYRFKFVMIFTAVCACLTIIAFGMTRFGEGQLRWGDYDDSPLMNYSGSFLTGVYGMWNIYTILILVLYAPSHKQYPQARI
uniref:Wntless-like transmembrane domain-containing protein n=1 Tax=Romanomermis culicivorax TaxID=13658 RepID=A0A915JHZ9_ROMCU